MTTHTETIAAQTSIGTRAFDPITEAWMLCERLWASVDVTEIGERRIDRILVRARARLQRREFAELDTAQCVDCVCPFCRQAAHAKMCPAIRAGMEDDAGDVQRDLDRLIDTHGTVEGLRAELATGDEAVGALVGALDKTVTYIPFCDCESCAAIDTALAAALAAARAWLRRAG